MGYIYYIGILINNELIFMSVKECNQWTGKCYFQHKTDEIIASPIIEAFIMFPVF